MNALRAIHAALVPGGLVIDTQPVSAQPPIEGEAGALGMLDMREWAALIDDIDRRVGDAVASGLFVVVHESRLTVTDAYDDGDDFLANVRDWVGTRVDPDVALRVGGERGRVRLHQEVRMRLLRAA